MTENDNALMEYLLAGMRRFKYCVQTRNANEPWGHIFNRVESACQRAKAEFQRELQQEAAQGVADE